MGKLIVKAALSVFICCLIYEFCDIGTGVPFYSGIAAIICLQPEIRNTFRVGLNRTIGTLIGGFTGMAALFVIRAFSIFRLPSLQYLLISLCIVPLMYIAKAIKKNPLSAVLRKNDQRRLLSIAPLVFFADFMRKSALTNITCVAFLSVTITHGADTSISGFAMNRILDTLIGVFVSFFINLLPMGHQVTTVHHDDIQVE
ncbi:MAG: FUSC family protein [Oxalobacter sp.]|uniref:FUSC family protein n=1 Tax=Oxalobacter paeniformigenes TaxID=2946594 RepID=UPI0022AEDD98|nr:FUSC family protein [Oxalobacter paeniformigenes]MBS7404801.1 FUSC family protein [Oxalobacter sp.]MCZ4052424.1 FUSC family protein [Oxalobacter paeniformigenes]